MCSISNRNNGFYCEEWFNVYKFYETPTCPLKVVHPQSPTIHKIKPPQHQKTESKNVVSANVENNRCSGTTDDKTYKFDKRFYMSMEVQLIRMDIMPWLKTCTETTLPSTTSTSKTEANQKTNVVNKPKKLKAANYRSEEKENIDKRKPTRNKVKTKQIKNNHKNTGNKSKLLLTRGNSTNIDELAATVTLYNSIETKDILFSSFTDTLFNKYCDNHYTPSVTFNAGGKLKKRTLLSMSFYNSRESEPEESSSLENEACSSSGPETKGSV